MKIIVVIPTRNEERSIERVIMNIYDMKKQIPNADLGVLVVDDSTDNTPQIAKSLGAYVLKGEGKGLGVAMLTGLKKAAGFGADVIVSIDGDGQFDPYEIPKLIAPFIEDKADLVLGSRFLGSIEYNMPLSKRFGNAVLNWMVRRITHHPITDAQTGFRAMTRQVAHQLDILGTHTYVQESIIDAFEKNFRVLEVPVCFRPREHGVSKVVSSVRRYAVWTLPVLLLRAGVHMMFFMILGALMFLAGLLYGANIFITENFDFTRLFMRQPAFLLTTLLIVLGILLFFSGIILHMLISLKYKLDRIIYG